MITKFNLICLPIYECDVESTVTIVPGVTTGQLMQFFLANDVCFMADVILSSVTYGGVFSGGCHVR